MPSAPSLRPSEAINLAGQDTGREHLSPSSISTQLACMERFRWKYVERLEPNVRAVSLRMGDAFARAIEIGDPERAWTLVHGEHARLQEAHGGDPWTAVPSREDALTEAQVAQEAARAYLARYGRRERREVEFKARLRNPATGRYSRTFDVQCRVDGLSEDGAVLIEDKLTGKIPRRDASRLVKLDRQISINCYLAWRCTSRAPGNVRYRWTLKPSIRQKKDESHDEYLARIAEEYATRQDHYLLEEPAGRSPEDFLRLEGELWHWAAQRREAARDGVYTRNVDSCRDFGGCVYLDLCCRSPAADQQFHVREKKFESGEGEREETDDRQAA